jgi:hypothetical protein
MAIAQFSPLTGAAVRVFVSQSWKWLTERCGDLPQVRLVFDEQLPKFAERCENFVDL